MPETAEDFYGRRVLIKRMWRNGRVAVFTQCALRRKRVYRSNPDGPASRSAGTGFTIRARRFRARRRRRREGERKVLSLTPPVAK